MKSAPVQCRGAFLITYLQLIMKKIFYAVCSLLLLTACQANRPAADLSSAEAAHKILTDYVLSDSRAEKFFPYLAQCKLAPAQADSSKTYFCSVEKDANQSNIALISIDPLLIREMEYYQKPGKELVYIALLKLEKEEKHLTGTKLLFNTYTKSVEKQMEVNEG